MTTIAVAGAGGFIGSHVVERLAAGRHPVVAIDRDGADLSIAERAGAEVRRADLLQPGAAESALRSCERVVNATGLFDLSASEAQLDKINVELTARIARGAARAGARRLVHISSVAVYGKPARRPMHEGGQKRPRNPYEITKRRGERAALRSDVPEVAVLRPTLVYGPRSAYGQAMMIATAAQARALGARRLPLIAGGPLGHHVHVEDVAQAVELAAFVDDAKGRCFNVADDTPLPFGDSLMAIARAFGLDGLFPSRPHFTLAAPLWTLVGKLTRGVPSALLERLNNQLARGHRALKKHGFEARLRPRFDRDWLQYLAGDYVFDTRALGSLGFVAQHTDFRASIRSVVGWYRRHRWIATQT